MSRRSFPLLTVLALLAVLIAAAPVSASSRGCLNLGPGCGANVDPATGLGWHPKGGAATVGNPVNARPVAGGGTGTDWLRTQPVSSAHYRYQYAPGGTGSGLCASDPGPPDGIVLRPCNTRNWQEFTPGPGGTLADVATGLPVRDNGQGAQLTGTAGAATRWGWHRGRGGQMPAPPGYATRIFEDQFTGPALDASKWVTYVGDRGIRWNDRGLLPAPYSGSNQPGATNRAMYSPAQLTVGNGLAITAQRNTGPYSGTYPWVSGTVNTEGKFTLPRSPWFVQAKIKMPDTSQGMWPSMWFLCAVPCSPENELDGWEGGFHELPGVPANRTAHYDYQASNGTDQHASEQDIGTDISQGYHVYGVRFIPGQSVTYYFDGAQRFKVTAGGGVAIPALPYELMLNMPVGAPVSASYHTVPGSGTPGNVMRVAEVQAWTP